MNCSVAISHDLLDGIFRLKTQSSKIIVDEPVCFDTKLLLEIATDLYIIHLFANICYLFHVHLCRQDLRRYFVVKAKYELYSEHWASTLSA